MTKGARRTAKYIWRPRARRAATILAALAALMVSPLTASADVIRAEYQDPTDRYDHAILGDALEWGSLVLFTDDGRRLRLTLPETRVFEDIAPRLITPPNGPPMVMVIETDIALGARLALYDEAGLITATPFIGRTHRWLAPIGAADLDGDGAMEIAYVDRPHLARTIRIWRLENRNLTHQADLAGFTNHRIGEDNIAGGIRRCAGAPEMIVADARWANVMAVTWDGQSFAARALAPHQGRQSFAKALNC